MNASIDLLLDLAKRPVETLESLWDRIDPAELNAHPGGHDNSLVWLLWHIGREIDVQIAQLARHEQTWSAAGFRQKFALNLPAHDLGYGHSPAQARAVVLPETAESKQLLFEHLVAVTDRATNYVRELSEADLAEVIDDSWDPPVTRGVRLVSIFGDALLHVGQVAYVTGMTDRP